MADIQHKNLPDSQLHGVKGEGASLEGQVLTSTGGAAEFAYPAAPSGVVTQGFWDYNDLATSSSPIALTVAGQAYELTNDGLGTYTNLAYALPGKADIWDVATDRFDFTGGALGLGDTLDFRFDLLVTTSQANTEVTADLELGLGGSSYSISAIPPISLKSAGAYHLVRYTGVYIGDNNTLDNPARVIARADSTGVTVKVNGWYVRALHTN
jgi:hypothetical protein